MKRNIVIALTILLIVFLVTLIPECLRSVDYGEEMAAVGGVKTIHAAQEDFFQLTDPHSYAGSLEQLGATTDSSNISLIDPGLASGEKGGYKYSIVTGSPRMLRIREPGLRPLCVRQPGQ